MTRAKPGALVLRQPGRSPSHLSQCRTSYRGPRYQLANGGATVEARQAAGVPVAVIDGPYDAAALLGILAHAPFNLGTSSCGANPSSACDHGTFIMGLLGARRDAVIPGLCPNCKLLHVPLFIDDNAPSADVGELANAIRVAVATGARFINLSLAILGDDSRHDRELAAALDYAEAKDVVVVVAAGNQGRLAMGQLLSHPVTIPVVATDAAGRLLPESNFGPAISQRGIAALGHQVLGYAPGTGTTVMSGTSVATAVATGTLAGLWSAHPSVTGETLRTAVALLAPRNGSVPPMIDRNVLSMMLQRTRGTMIEASAVTQRRGSNYASLQGGPVMKDGNGMPGLSSRSTEFAASPPNIVTPSSAAGGCACGAAPGEVCSCVGNKGASSGFVYAIGTVEVEYPNVAIEREMQAIARALQVRTEPGAGMPMRPTEDRAWQHAVLSTDRRRTRYLARQLSWRLSIEEVDVFVLKPSNSEDVDELIDCLKRPKYPQAKAGKGKSADKDQSGLTEPPFGLAQDLDVIVGVVGPQTPGGIELAMDQIFTIPPDQLPRPGFGEHFEQVADNWGMTDVARAYNYLLARYELTPKNLRDIGNNYVLADVPTFSSRLGGDASRIIRVVFTYKHRTDKTEQEKKFFVRVDVTHEFPYILTGWTPYLERGEAT
jgi:hypothetical protein